MALSSTRLPSFASGATLSTTYMDGPNKDPTKTLQHPTTRTETTTKTIEATSPTISAPTGADASEVNRRFLSVLNLNYEMVRLDTFNNWPVKFVTKEDLARNGFFYMHRNDMVQCVYCKGVVGCFEEGDIPRLEHRRHYPRCPFVKDDPSINNVPNDGSPLNIFLESFAREKMHKEQPPRPKLIYTTDSVKGQGVAYPGYADEQKRSQTFRDQPPNMPDRSKMAAAGLFYTWVSDMANCYSCGGGIFNWSKDDDPVAIHSQLYPLCGLSGQGKVVAGAELAGSEAVPTEEQTKERENEAGCRILNKSEEALLMTSNLAQHLSGLFKAPFVRKALSSELCQRGFLPATLDEAIDIVYDFEG